MTVQCSVPPSSVNIWPRYMWIHLGLDKAYVETIFVTSDRTVYTVQCDWTMWQFSGSTQCDCSVFSVTVQCSVFSVQCAPPPSGFIRYAATPHCLKLPKKISFVPSCLNKYSKTFGTVLTKTLVKIFEWLKDMFFPTIYFVAICRYIERLIYGISIAIAKTYVMKCHKCFWWIVMCGSVSNLLSLERLRDVWGKTITVKAD